MQPFGLFSLLQNLLENTAKPDATTAQDSATETAPAPAPEPPPASVENNNRQAILDFLNAHDSRAQKMRKH